MPLNNAMDWDKLRIFHAVADAGSFTHAGHDLGLSQSAVSRQISALEDALNVPLFHRHARGLILTEQGEMLYRTAHEVFTKLTAAQTRLMDSKEKPSGELRITTTVGLGSVWLTPRLREFSEIYPQINVTLLLDDLELDLSMREADVAIRLRRPTQPDLIPSGLNRALRGQLFRRKRYHDARLCSSGRGRDRVIFPPIGHHVFPNASMFLRT